MIPSPFHDREAPLLLERTRSAVANVLVVAGCGIAFGGVLLRWRGGWASPQPSEPVRIGGIAILVGLALASHLARRFSARTPAGFYRGHLAAAILAALAVPLGIGYGWYVRPTLDVVAPFWIVALTLGALAIPRTRELASSETPPTPDPAPREPNR